MPFFNQAQVAQLYLGTNLAGDQGQVVAVLPQPGPPSFEIADAIKSTALNASIVFLQQPIDPSAQQSFVNNVLGLLTKTGASRVLLWTPGAASFAATTQPIYAALRWTQGTPPALVTGSQLTAPIAPNLNFIVPTNMGLTAPPSSDVPPNLNAATTATLYSSNISLGFSSPPLANIGQVNEAWLPFSGINRGCIVFDAFITQQILGSANWGFQFRFSAPGPSPSSPIGDTVLSVPLAAPSATSMVRFLASVDPLDPYNAVFPRRTGFAFVGTDYNRNPTVLASYYRTVTGQTINLVPVGLNSAAAGQQPARLVFAVATSEVVNPLQTHLAPEGDFVLQLATGTPATATLLSGLDGGEYLQFRPKTATYAGDRLRFVSRQFAYTPNFPFPLASPIGPPAPVNPVLLNDTSLTSWGVLVSSSTGLGSVAQPSGFHLFGYDIDTIHPTHSALLGVMDVGVMLGAGATPYPIVPYAGVMPGDGVQIFSAAQIVSYESQVIGPTRRSALSQLAQSDVVSVQAALGPPIPPPPPWPAATNVTTPSGLVVTLTGDTTSPAVAWSEILLGQLVNPLQQFAFANPGVSLQTALQTGQLLLVVANALNFGNGARFQNELTIDDWGMTAKVGQGSSFGDYANIMIIKGVPGKLFDANNPGGSLVANPTKWTLANIFAAPTTQRDPIAADATQLVNLAQWLQAYFQSAWDDPDTTFFQDFNDIAASETWTGILVLKATITQIPSGLAGITAGITDLSLFNVHHLALPISPLTNGANGPQIDGSTAVSGLIHYLDPSLDPTQPVTVVQPSGSGDYDFRLLTLKVLFENAAVKAFSSYAQITLDRLFGTVVAPAGQPPNPPFNTLMLQGSYQLVGQHPVYSFGSTVDAPLYLASNIITRIETTSVQMVTQQADPAGNTVSWFGISGFIDFMVVPGAANSGIDVFSFGNLPPPAAPVPRQGLRFENLGLRLSFPTQQPTQRTFDLVTSQIRFDLSASTPRSGSLVSELALELQGLQAGSSGSAPLQLGYLPVITDFRPAGLGDAWQGLAFRLNLGTPGALAGKVGFDASMLFAWSPDSNGAGNWQMEVGIKLPGTGQGAPLISLQNVIKLSMGPIRLAYDTTNKAYVLMLTEIALSLFGLLKIPPNGAISFFLFGNPKGASSADGLGWYALYDNEPAAGAKALIGPAPASNDTAS
jgi:7,8-dihydro-6-hydroxymethylpterin-pyrophosphokinase